MVMELLEGETFADLLAKEKLTTQRVIQLLSGALAGLAAAHENGIIHRDIKPENIFIVRDREHPEGIAKLLDFGISKLDERTPGGPRLTQTGLSIGTPLYMSMEQLTGTSEVDQRADIYSFGVVLYHALSGSLPFDGETFAGVVVSIATTTPPPLRRLRPDLSPALDRVVSKAMARHRHDRYANVAELLAALRAIEDTAGHAGQPSGGYAALRTPGPPPGNGADLGLDESLAELDASQRATSRRRLLIALVTGLLLVGVGFGLTRAARAPSRSHADQAADASGADTRSTAPAGISAPPSLPRVGGSQAPSARESGPAVDPLPVQAPTRVHLTPPPEEPAAHGRSRASADHSSRAAKHTAQGAGTTRGKSSLGERTDEPRAGTTASRQPPGDGAGSARALEGAPRPEAAPDIAPPPPRAVPTTPTPTLSHGKSGGLLREDF
jgi:serine/threonine-protein kinase